MCSESLPRCVRVTHEKVCIYTRLYVCCFEDKKRCVAVTHPIYECTFVYAVTYLNRGGVRVYD